MSQKVCRLCLVKPSIHFSLLDGNFAQMLEALTFTKVTPNDEISTIVCLKCLLNLKLAYSFQQRIKKSEEKLFESVKIKEEMLTPKEEICDDESTKTYDDLVKLYSKNCIICGLSVDHNLMNDHIREHFTNEQKCGFCEKTFSDIQLYREHLLEHPEKKIHECEACHAKFRYKTFYDLHIKTVCSVETSVQQRIATLGLYSKQAINILTEENKKCKIITALSSVAGDENAKKKVIKLGLRSSKAIRVLLGNEPKDEDLICKICFKKFTKKSFQCHSHETKTCNICNREIAKYAFKRHVEDHSLGPQICHLCGATLQNRSCLHAHIFYSHNELRYKCDECGRIFQKKNARDLHVRKEHIGKHTHFCDKCGKGFFNSTFLNKHIKMKHLKLRPHICEFCNKGFSSQYALKTHRRQHTQETPYRCEICGEGFRQNVSLRSHRKSKHNIIEETTCHCKVCGKGFGSQPALDSHMRLHN